MEYVCCEARGGISNILTIQGSFLAKALSLAAAQTPDWWAYP